MALSTCTKRVLSSPSKIRSPISTRNSCCSVYRYFAVRRSNTSRSSAINTLKTSSSRLVVGVQSDRFDQSELNLIFLTSIQATNTIKELASASEALTTQSSFLREQQKERRSYLAKLKGQQGVRSPPQPTIKMVSKRVAVPQSILDCVSKTRTAAPPSTTVTTTTTSPTTASQPKESVIVLDDD